MAKLGEGDQRWIVKEREDGRNCNNWHWTSKDVSKNTKEELIRCLEACTFEPPIALARVKSAEVTGEASINNRKGKIFLIYDLEVKLKWEASDGEGGEACKGSMKLPDVSATMLDDLDCEFTCKSSGGVATAMRKQGVAAVRRCIEEAMLRMQEEVRAEKARPEAEAVAETRPPNATPAVAVPLPKPIAVSTVPAKQPPPQPKPPEPAAGSDSGEEEEGEDKLPPALEAALRGLRQEPEAQREVCLANCSLRDSHLEPLIQALHHSRCAVETLDLAFNRLSDAGVHVLCRAVASGCAMELSSLRLGGNKLSPAGLALGQSLKQSRPDLLVDLKPQLKDARSMCTVGNVYPGSPAATAGLRTGDSIIAFGPLLHAGFRGVSESIVPAVKASVGRPIDVVVVRMGEGAQVQQLALTLTPQTWSGGGLLGCILK
mmetsp:Transcript_47345/g.153854  ORF Transcript_47345/g.153854 Transcript_47345/m.153854 type:complete len:431 (-) Transcript_47345:154-1446(-)